MRQNRTTFFFLLKHKHKVTVPFAKEQISLFFFFFDKMSACCSFTDHSSILVLVSLPVDKIYWDPWSQNCPCPADAQPKPKSHKGFFLVPNYRGTARLSVVSTVSILSSCNEKWMPFNRRCVLGGLWPKGVDRTEAQRWFCEVLIPHKEHCLVGLKMPFGSSAAQTLYNSSNSSAN